MNSSNTRIGIFSLIVSGALLVPLSIRLSNGGQNSPASAVLSLNEACGQATACDPAVNYICSTAGGDLVDYKCAENCGPRPPDSGGDDPDQIL